MKNLIHIYLVIAVVLASVASAAEFQPAERIAVTQASEETTSDIVRLIQEIETRDSSPSRMLGTATKSAEDQLVIALAREVMRLREEVDALKRQK